MNDNEQQLQKLKKLLIGRTIIKIEKSNIPEAICKITTNNDTSFSLCATELGFWIQEESDKEGYFQTLNDLIICCYYYVNNHGSFNDFKIHKINNELIFTNDITEFKMSITSLSSQELKIINSEIGRSLLKLSIDLGEAWKIIFSKTEEECPEELYLI